MAIFREKLILDKKNRTIAIRSLSVSEAEALLVFKKRVSEETDFLLSSPEIYKNRTAAQEEAWIEKLNSNPRSFLMILDFEGTMIGMLDFHAFADRKRMHRGFLGISILKDWQGQGLGKKLMNSFFELIAKELSIEFVELSVMSTNTKALNLYQSLGFQEVSRLPEAFQVSSQRVDEVHMRRHNPLLLHAGDSGCPF